VEVYGGQRRQTKVTVALKNIFQMQSEWDGRQKHQKAGRQNGRDKKKQKRKELREIFMGLIFFHHSPYS
jgi:hypothetical protein